MAIKAEDIYVAISYTLRDLIHPGLATWMSQGPSLFNGYT